MPPLRNALIWVDDNLKLYHIRRRCDLLDPDQRRTIFRVVSKREKRIACPTCLQDARAEYANDAQNGTK